MDRLQTRMAYLKGMADGIGISNSSKEGRIIQEMMKVMEEMAQSITRLDHRMDEQEEYLDAMDEDLADVEEYVEAIDEDLDDVEDILYMGNEDEDWDLDEDWDDADEEYSELDDDDIIYFDDDDDDQVICVDNTYNEYADGYDDDDIGYFEVECPNCQELVAIDQDIFDDEMVAEVLCPECHEIILMNDDIEETGEFGNYVLDDK
ncbi:MAG TPA: hypothetical protein VJ824_04705 [Bacillota bacterium]|nr:hypothetical protein [Bacillota bacterium]